MIKLCFYLTLTFVYISSVALTWDTSLTMALGPLGNATA